MSKKPLIETNPYLRDPEKYEKSLVANVASSTAIELGTIPISITRALETHNGQSQQITPNDQKESSEAQN